MKKRSGGDKASQRKKTKEDYDEEEDGMKMTEE
jgi:hypothetical protein